MSSYVAYEAAKLFWLRVNPHATSAEYEAACARLAKMYGI